MDAARLTYILRYFPSVTETFVEREIRCLARRGRVRAVIAWGAEPGCPELVEAAAGIPVLYVGDTPGRWLARGLARCLAGLMKNPAGAWRILGLAGGDIRGQDSRGALRVLGIAARALSALPSAPRRGCFHAHFANDPAAMARYVGLAAGGSFSFTAHAYDIHKDPFLLARNMRAASAVVTVSEENAAILREIASGAGVEEGRIRVVHCGLDLGAFTPEGAVGAKASGAPPGRPPGGRALLLCVGRLVEKKGHETLLRAVGVLKGRGRDLALVLVGEGPLRQRLEEVARRLGLEAIVRFEGAAPFSRVRELLDSADVFVLASTRGPDGDRDGIPVALLEAMASGLPVVSTQLPGIREAVPEGSGLLVPPDSPGALAEAIDQALSLSPADRRAMCDRARRAAAEGFDVERCATELLDAILPPA